MTGAAGRGTLAALRHREFRLLWIGQLISNVGWWMQFFGLGWLVVELAVAQGTPEAAPLYIGLVGLSRAIPSLSLSLVAGAIADRTERRRLLLITQSAAAALTVALAVLTTAGTISIGAVMFISFLTATVGSFDSPARQSMLPRLVPARDIMSAIGIQSAAVQGTGVIGPALGGLLIASIGVGGLFWANAVSYLASIVALLLIGPVHPEPDRVGRSVLQSVSDAIRHIWHDPVLRAVFALGLVASLLARPYANLLPAVVVGVLHGGAGELSLLLTVTGVGALAGSFAIASSGRLAHRGQLFLASVAATGVLVVALAGQSTIGGMAAIALALGFAVLAFMGLAAVILQTTTPPPLLGRVMSAYAMLFMGIMPLGQLLLGSIASVVGVSEVLAAAGLVTAAVAGIALLKAPALRGPAIEPRRAEAAEQVALMAAE